MTMDAVTIETLPTTKSLLSTKVPESTDIAKEKDDDILFIDEIDEDDEIRLRLSDDEEVEQENTLEHTENQEASLQLKKDDLEFDVHVAVTPKEATKSHQELIIRQDLPETNTVALIKNQNIQNSSKKKFSNESCNVNDEESTMSGSEKAPPLTQNSRKFWSNNFDKRWKGINSPRGRQNFSHRNSNDWYNQQYQEKDKFNNRNNFNHHNNHFNKLRHNIRGNYNNKSGGNRNKDIQKDEAEESLKSKHNIRTLENTNDKKHSIQENGISNNAQSKKKDSSIQNSSMKMNDKESKVAETDLNPKKNAQNSNEDASCNVKTHNENDNNSNIGILVDNEMKNNENTMDNILNDNENLSVTKDCDVSMIECEKENCESKSEEIKKRKANKCNSDMADKTTNSDTNSASNDVEFESKQNSVEKYSELSSDIQIIKIASHDENLLENKSEIEMEIDNSNEDLSTHTDKDSNSDQIRECDNAKDIVLELSENNNKSLSEKFDAEQQADNINVFNDKESSEAVETNENTNHSLDDKSISQMETSEIEQTDSKEIQTTNSEEDSKILNENIETESSSILISCIDVKDSDANDIDKNEKKNEEICLLENDKINSDVKKETEAGKIKQISKKSKDATVIEGEEKLNSTGSNEQEKLSGPIEEVDLVDDESEMAVAVISNDIQSDTLKNKDDVTSTTTTVNKDTSQIVPISNEDGNKVEESNKDGRAVVHKRRRRKRLSNVAYLEIASNEIQTDEFFNSVKMLIENGVRQKRRSARNAEEMIRKEILKNDEDDEDSSDESGKLVPVNYKKPNYTQSLSPPSLKRTLDDADCISESVTLKRIKSSGDNSSTTIPQSNENKEYVTKSKESIAETNELVRQISQEDIRGKLKKLKQEELEALLLQKIVECITIRGEMGKLREQARVSKRNQEATRTKCQQLQKQVEGFDMVLKRISFDKNSNNDKYAPPIKINRSVGLQVNFLSDHGIHNLKQIQAMKTSAGNTSTAVTAKTTLTTTTPSTATMTTAQDNRSLTQSPRKMLKVRSPRRPETSSPAVAPGSPGSATNSTANSNNTTSTTLVMSKPMDQSPKRTITLQNSNNNIVQLMPAGQQQQAVVVNSNIAGSTTRATTSLSVQKPNNTVANKASDLIDLTDEEDKSKTSVISPITTGITTRFPRVLQAVPASVALNNQANLRLVQGGGNQASQTAIVNNINTPRLAYVMQSGVPTRQLVLTNSNTIRPVTTVSTRNISTISYKQGVPTLTNGTVRVLTAQNPTTNLQHPAPLPESSVPESNPSWKSPPPAPSLKISKVATGIVLSWNMSLSDKFAEIVSYQLYAYQEVAGTSPSASLWKKVGDVRALPLPMACTLTQFTEGNNYYFAVRAVDIHSRFGQYSKPGNISL
ncbi:PREDICTED: MATH and LRR domain-containing protein PFE0570w [Ceratosolen solmsi marchali]|uniref:MATH and LRR domain-containing protein PFE0570w n=1 Tax=Ceratosolen solmsi marchali TaxID=326594 RepID=A0AAJ6YUD9_9HYME|nr:PREDICTED: MATH and LRR domain-containing protein PFE0570w [Ceratosolen solmsi marchali]